MASRFMVVVGLSAIAAATAQAAEVRGTFSTLLNVREEPRGDEAVSSIPLYELAALHIDGLGVPGTDESRVVLQGWGRLQLGDDELNDSTGDVTLLFAEARRGGLHLRLGRQHLTEGVDRLQVIDGLRVGYQTDFGLIAQAFAGLLAHPEFDLDGGDWQAGGRLAYRLGLQGEVGLAYSQQRRGGDLARQKVGADGFYQLGDTRVNAIAVVGPDERRLIEARLAVSRPLRPDLYVTLDAERTAPDLFIPRTSLFSVFAETEHDALGGDVQWDPSPYYSLTASGHWLRLENESLGYRAALRAATYREASHRSLVGLEARRVDERDNAYLRGRVFTGLQILPVLRVTADVFAYRYDEEIRGESASYLGQLSAIYDLAPSMRIAATVSGGMTPFAESQVEGFVRFAYGYETDLAREATP